jgi:hypothetical protein
VIGLALTSSFLLPSFNSPLFQKAYWEEEPLQDKGKKKKLLPKPQSLDVIAQGKEKKGI